MNSNAEVERVFPLSGGSSERVALRAPRLIADPSITPGFVMGNRAFLRTWASRRVQAAHAARSAALRASAERGRSESTFAT